MTSPWSGTHHSERQTWPDQKGFWEEMMATIPVGVWSTDKYYSSLVLLHLKPVEEQTEEIKTKVLSLTRAELRECSCVWSQWANTPFLNGVNFPTLLPTH